MKIAVFSDTHGSYKGMLKAVHEYQPEQIIHLGDGMRDTEALMWEFPEIPVCCVPGNCDHDYESPEYKVITLGTLKTFITHGHRYAVRGGGVDTLLYAAECSGAQIAMFGHTHRAVFTQVEGIFVLNPGTAGKPPQKTYAQLEIGPTGEVSCEIVPIPD